MESAKKVSWYQFKWEKEALGVPIQWFLPCAALVVLSLIMGWLPSDGFVRSIAVLLAVGGTLSWIGGVTPLIRAVGGKLILPLFGSMILSKMGAFPDTAAACADLLMNNGFQMFFVASIVVGTIFATDSKLLRASSLRYLPVLLISQVFALLFAFLATKVTGRSFYEAVFFVAAPCMAGGTSGAITTLPALYSSVLGQDMSALAGTLYATAMLGTYISFAMVVLMKILANSFPKLMDNGNGELLKRDAERVNEAQKNMISYPKSTSYYGDLIGGLFISLVVMALGSIMSQFIPQIVYIAWALIIALLLKILRLVPDSLSAKAYCWSQFSQDYLVIITVTAIGLASSGGGSLSSVLSGSTIIIIVLSFLGAIVGAMIAAVIFGLYRYEATLTAAMCACNIGASGDIQMLATSDRMNLLAFATISTRIGGAMMLIEISLLFPWAARLAGMI
jgi:Na+/citrate or Na+/malate symporter